jgi:beta-phosphoglucomutase
MFSAFLFDLDGTLFDSSRANIAAYSKAFQDVGVVFDEEKYRHLFGLRFDEMAKAIAPDADAQTLSTIRSLKVNYYKESLHLVKPNQALIELLKDISLTHATALVTTASSQNVKNLLAFFEVAENLFNVCITGEDVSHSKPHPECYTKAIEALQVEPAKCLVFEDSTIGVEAAERAGTQVIRITI